MKIIRDMDTLRQWCRQQHTAGEPVALVPTMGALHAGHMALVEAAKRHTKQVVLSIFVNPAQFGPNEDFDHYPRTEAEDIAMAQKHAVSAVWVPSVAVMYPEGFATTIHVKRLGEGLCGAYRPGHFDGVATVVAKLLLQTGADAAFFGEKDFQQLAIIRKMVADLNIPVQIMPVATVREKDGLALSSRNRYLSKQAREIAPKLYALLQQLAHYIKNGGDADAGIAQVKTDLLEAGFSKIDYIAYVNEVDLLSLRHYQPGGRLCAAAFLGNTRLIDNIEVA